MLWLVNLSNSTLWDPLLGNKHDMSKIRIIVTKHYYQHIVDCAHDSSPNTSTASGNATEEYLSDYMVKKTQV
jgi:hypothetical protein